jgi:site-specific recombinase XerD
MGIGHNKPRRQRPHHGRASQRSHQLPHPGPAALGVKGCTRFQRRLESLPHESTATRDSFEPGPTALDRPTVRKLLREIELRHDVRAGAIFSPMLYTGCRVSDLVNLELADVLMNECSGSVIFRHGKGGKQRTVPVPVPARTALQSYLDTRPSVASGNIFVGERGPMTDCGVRALCRKYSAIIGVRLHPHVFRHTMAKQFLADNGNDLVSLAQILGHENLQTTSRYSQRTSEQLAEASERVGY